jgi:energy-coupling factor transporter ATP-binding protein EcfA2
MEAKLMSQTELVTEVTLVSIPKLQRVHLDADLLRDMQANKKAIITPDPLTSKPCTNPTELFDEVKAFVKMNVELQDDVHYDVLGLFIMATWLTDRMQTATYINVLAPHGSGKSTLIQVLQYLTRRSVNTDVATKGVITRIAEQEPTLLLDECDNWLNSRDFDNPLAAVLNGGYKRKVLGGGALVCEPSADGTYTPVRRETFGFKVIAGRNPLNDVMRSRTIKILMRRSLKKFSDLDVNVAWTLRQKLLGYRELVLSQNIGEGHFTLAPEDRARIPEPRMAEVFGPLVMVAPNSQVKERILNLAAEEYKQVQQEELTSVEARIALTILSAAKSNPDAKRIPISNIVGMVNYNASNPHEELNPRYISILLKRLGFNTLHTRSGSVLDLKPDLLDYLRTRYPVEPEELPTLPPVPTFRAENRPRIQYRN